MAVLSLIQQYNDLFGGINKAKTVEDMRTLETAVKGFYNDYKGADIESTLRIVNMYADKLHSMVSDNSATFDKLNEKLSNIKGREYDFAGEKDDTGAVQTRMLQLMGQLPKTKTTANASAIKNTINEVISSGVVGSKAVLQLMGYPAYTDMVDEMQKHNAVEGSKSEAQKVAERYNDTEYQKVSAECAETYNTGFLLRGMAKNMDNFQKSARNEATPESVSYWSNNA